MSSTIVIIDMKASAQTENSTSAVILNQEDLETEEGKAIRVTGSGGP
jgi:hypothetical protein